MDIYYSYTIVITSSLHGMTAESSYLKVDTVFRQIKTLVPKQAILMEEAKADEQTR
jgi:hypothetical protein